MLDSQSSAIFSYILVIFAPFSDMCCICIIIAVSTQVCHVRIICISLSLSLSLYIYIYIFVLYSVMIIYIYIYTGIYLYLLLCYIYIYIYSAIGGYIRLCLLYSAMLTFTCVCVCVCYFLSILLRHMIFACLPSSTIFATFVEFGHIRECSSIFYVFGKFFFHEVHLYFLMYSAYLPTYVHYV